MAVIEIALVAEMPEALLVRLAHEALEQGLEFPFLDVRGAAGTGTQNQRQGETK